VGTHVADATEEVGLLGVAQDLGAEIAFRMANRVFVVKPFEDAAAPGVIRAGLAAAARRHGYHSTDTKVGCHDADADSSGV
jgi:hypothetical protein